MGTLVRGLVLAGVVSAMLAACFGGDTDNDSCVGGERCACFANNTCDAGLMCVSSVCVAAIGQGGTSGGGSGGQSGSNGGTPPSGGNTGTAGTAVGGAPDGVGGMPGDAGAGGTPASEGGAGGTPASEGGAGGTPASEGGAGGTPSEGGAGGADPCGNLVDDMEDADNTTCKNDERWGTWFAYDTGGDLPPPEPALLTPARGASQFGIHFVGSDSPAGIGFTFSFYYQWEYDASAYTGIQFYAKAASATTILARFHSMDTTADDWGGTCLSEPPTLCVPNDADVDLTTNWVLKTIPFTYPSGGSAPFDKSEAVSITFYAPSGSYDFWIDDVTLY